MIELNNSGNHTLADFNYTYTYGDSNTYNGNGTYTINNPTTIHRSDWYTNYHNVNNKYVCKNATNNTCSVIWYVRGSSITQISYIDARIMKYAKGFTWDGSKYILDNNTSVSFWNFLDSTNQTSLPNAHYTCWNTTGECTSLSYIYEISGNVIAYIDLTNGESIEDALNKMLYANDVNTINSTIKKGIDAWYTKYLSSYDSYIEDTIFCNDRSISSLGGWNPNGGVLTGSNSYLQFKEYNKTSDLSCTNNTDQFSTLNTKAQLTYKVGLMSSPEMNLLNNAKARVTGQNYLSLSPNDYELSLGKINNISTAGEISYDHANSSYGVRPAISLKPETKYTSGDGSMASPYIVSTN